MGHISPEAAQGGPIALVEEGDLIRLDIPGRRLDLVGVDNREMTPAQVEEILAERRRHWKPRPSRYEKGVLKLFADRAVSPMKGGYM